MSSDSESESATAGLLVVGGYNRFSASGRGGAAAQVLQDPLFAPVEAPPIPVPLPAPGHLGTSSERGRDEDEDGHGARVPVDAWISALPPASLRWWIGGTGTGAGSGTGTDSYGRVAGSNAAGAASVGMGDSTNESESESNP